jgi:predicted ABC-type ATPase
MPKNEVKRLRVLAGPNGSGKSTIVKKIRTSYYCGPFVNADDIQQIFKQKKVLNLEVEYGLTVDDNDFEKYLSTIGASWLNSTKVHSSLPNISFWQNNLVVNETSGDYDAAIAADFIRHQLLAQNNTFTFETVLSHTSKLEFLKQAEQAGYKNYLYFVCTADPAINIKRVEQRVALGGHGVPKEKIISRYYGSLQLLPQLLPHTHRTFLFDNSAENSAINLIAEIVKGNTINLQTQSIPWWVEKYVISPLF